MSEDAERAEPSLAVALAVDSDDPEVIRARAATEARLLGVPFVPTRIGRFLLLERIGAGGMGIVYAAFDPELERKVALKLLFERGGTARDQERIRSEARAMAKLAHPNVVQVYEAGEHRGRIFIVMEHVRGRTLRAWWSERSRPEREILAMCVQAGRGLAAAHAAGLVHGDFKPDNVLVGEDGRARVVDFGLARVVDDEVSAEDASVLRARDSGPATEGTARFRGTLGYVSPRRARGEPADARSDVFAFCVTVWEALTNTRPHAGNTAEEVIAAVLDRRIAIPPRATISTRVEQELRRGLSADALGLDDLLEALSRDPAARRRRWVVGFVAVAAVAGAFAIGSSLHGTDLVEPCTGSEAAFADAWPRSARDAAFDHVEAVGGEYGKTVVPRFRAQIDVLEPRWIAAHRDACLAHARGEQSAELLDRRMLCLHRARAAVAALGEVTASVDAEKLSSLVFAFEGLPDPDACGDAAALMRARESPPPEAWPLVERLGRVKVLFEAGRIEEAAATAPGVVADARALGHRPLLAAALRVYGLVELELMHRVDAARILQEATEVALAAGDDETALVSWANRAYALATESAANEGDPLEGRAYMVALAERDPTSTGAMSLWLNLGGAEIARGTIDRAREAFSRAFEIAETRSDAAREVAMAKQQLGFVTEDPDERARLLDGAVSSWTMAAGSEHPRTLTAELMRALLNDDLAVARARMERPCRDLRAFHAWDREGVSGCLQEIAVIDEVMGDAEAELATTAQWVEVATEADAPLARGRLALLRGDLRSAVDVLERGMASLQKEVNDGSPWFLHVYLGMHETALGRAWVALGDPRGAPLLQRALQRLEEHTRGMPQPNVQRRVAAARRAVEQASARAP